MPGKCGGLEFAGTGLEPEWQRWRDQRPATSLLHLDSAAAGRSSHATLRASASHAEREAAVGVQVAAAEAQPVLAAGRVGLAGLLGVPPGGVAYVQSGTAALEALLSAWPLRAGDTAAVVPSEWGRNLAAFGRHGLRLAEIAVDGDGRVDLEALQAILAKAPPAFVHLTQVASHRCLVQPVAEAARLCRAAGIPLWVDAAQALGHVDTACGADVLYATSRKWLTGPRGAGMLAVADRWWSVLGTPATWLKRGDALPGFPVRLLESPQASVSSQVGLCMAVGEYLHAEPPRVWQRLAEVGSLTRKMLGDLPGWAVLQAGGVSSAITAVRATAGQDIGDTRARLLARHGIITTAARPARAPREMTEPLLRISPHVDCSIGQLAFLRDALTAAR